MGRIVPLNGETFSREGSVRPQHVDPSHEQYGPVAMSQAIQAGMLALEAADKIGTPIANGVRRLMNSSPSEEEKNGVPVEALQTPESYQNSRDAEMVAANNRDMNDLRSQTPVAREGRRLWDASESPAATELGSVPNARQAAAQAALGVPVTGNVQKPYDPSYKPLRSIPTSAPTSSHPMTDMWDRFPKAQPQAQNPMRNAPPAEAPSATGGSGRQDYAGANSLPRNGLDNLPPTTPERTYGADAFHGQHPAATLDRKFQLAPAPRAPGVNTHVLDDLHILTPAEKLGLSPNYRAPIPTYSSAEQKFFAEWEDNARKSEEAAKYASPEERVKLLEKAKQYRDLIDRTKEGIKAKPRPEQEAVPPPPGGAAEQSPPQDRLTPATAEDRRLFANQSAERSLSQDQRTVDNYNQTKEQNARYNSSMLDAQDAAVKAAQDTYARQLAAAQAMQLPVPAMPEILKQKQLAVQAPTAMERQAAPVDQFSTRLAAVTDLEKLDTLRHRLPAADPRQKAIEQRMQELSVDQAFAPKDDTRFNIDPKKIYSFQELENLAQQMARSKATDQDRRNLLEAYQRSDGKGVPLASLSDLLTGAHVSRGGAYLSEILKTGIPRKSDEELAIERAYKIAMGASAITRANAAAQNADTNSDVKPRDSASKERKNDIDEGYKLGSGTLAPVEGQKAGGMLGVAQDKVEETKQHDYATEQLAIDNLGDYTTRGSLANYRDRSATAMLLRARNATADKPLTKAQAANLQKSEVESSTKDGIQEHRTNIAHLESIIDHPEPPPGDEPSHWDPDFSKWQARKSTYLGWKKAADAAKVKLISETDAIDALIAAKQAALKKITEEAGVVSHGHKTEPRNAGKKDATSGTTPPTTPTKADGTIDWTKQSQQGK